MIVIGEEAIELTVAVTVNCTSKFGPALIALSPNVAKSVGVGVRVVEMELVAEEFIETLLSINLFDMALPPF